MFAPNAGGPPALGKVHLGISCLFDGFALISGAYLPGPTEFGVAVCFFNPPCPSLRYPKVCFGAFLTSGRSFG